MKKEKKIKSIDEIKNEIEHVENRIDIFQKIKKSLEKIYDDALSKENIESKHKLEIKYPHDYFYFGEGVDISNDEIDKWIQESILELKKRLKKKKFVYRTHASGNAFVLCKAYYNKKNKNYKVDIIVAKNYHEFEGEI